MHSLSLTLGQPLIDRLGLPCFLSPCFTGWLYKVFDSKQSFFLLLFFFCFSKNIYTYHSLKFDDSVLWLVVWCTAEAAGDMELLLWFSVDGDTMVGGVEDSYPELAAGDGCDPGLVDSWTCSNGKHVVKIVLRLLFCFRFVIVQIQDIRNASKEIKSLHLTVLDMWKILKQSTPKTLLFSLGS